MNRHLLTLHCKRKSHMSNLRCWSCSNHRSLDSNGRSPVHRSCQPWSSPAGSRGDKSNRHRSSHGSKSLKSSYHCMSSQQLKYQCTLSFGKSNLSMSIRDFGCSQYFIGWSCYQWSQQSIQCWKKSQNKSYQFGSYRCKLESPSHSSEWWSQSLQPHSYLSLGSCFPC